MCKNEPIVPGQLSAAFDGHWSKTQKLVLNKGHCQKSLTWVFSVLLMQSSVFVGKRLTIKVVMCELYIF